MVLNRDFFLATGSHLTLLLTFGTVAFVLMWESFSARRAFPHSSFVRSLNNFVLAVMERGLVSFLLPLLPLAPPADYQGLLSRFDLPWWISLPITAVCLELAGYWFHRASHTVPWLWRVHLVHHSDTEVDASTAIRHHPLEGVLDTLVLTPVVLLLLPDPLVLLGWNFFTLAISAFSHGNISVPLLERGFGRAIVTPGFHCVHHSSEKAFTDSNYANNFPWMDDLFGTARRWTAEEQRTREMGLDYFRSDRDRWVDRLLLEPFLRQKPSAEPRARATGNSGR